LKRSFSVRRAGHAQTQMASLLSPRRQRCSPCTPRCPTTLTLWATKALEIMPDFIETVVIPLGTPVKKAETVHLPDGRFATVNQTNFLYAEGYPYALQLVLAGAVLTLEQHQHRSSMPNYTSPQMHDDCGPLPSPEQSRPCCRHGHHYRCQHVYPTPSGNGVLRFGKHWAKTTSTVRVRALPFAPSASAPVLFILEIAVCSWREHTARLFAPLPLERRANPSPLRAFPDRRRLLTAQTPLSLDRGQSETNSQVYQVQRHTLPLSGTQ
jgi:hypothetical protein